MQNLQPSFHAQQLQGTDVPGMTFHIEDCDALTVYYVPRNPTVRFVDAEFRFIHVQNRERIHTTPLSRN